MHRILKDATIAKTKRRRPTAEIFLSGGRRIITIRIDDKVAGYISEWQDKWYYKPSGVPSAKSQVAIGSTEEEVLDWWMRSQDCRIVEEGHGKPNLE